MQIQIRRAQMQAALYFAGVSDIRSYLNGVYVEPTATSTRLSATTGKILSVLRHGAENADLSLPGMIVPRAAVMNALALKIDLLTIVPAESWFSIGGATGRYLFQPIDARFPDTGRAVPIMPSGEPANYDPELLMAFTRAGKALGRRDKPIVRQNGRNGALVHFYAYDDFVGAIAPISPFTEEYPDLGFPTWAQG
jgi:DNA polymerase III beta subunit, central domain